MRAASRGAAAQGEEVTVAGHRIAPRQRRRGQVIQEWWHRGHCMDHTSVGLAGGWQVNQRRAG